MLFLSMNSTTYDDNEVNKHHKALTCFLKKENTFTFLPIVLKTVFKSQACFLNYNIHLQIIFKPYQWCNQSTCTLSCTCATVRDFTETHTANESTSHPQTLLQAFEVKLGIHPVSKFSLINSTSKGSDSRSRRHPDNT